MGAATAWAARADDLPGFVVLTSTGKGGQPQPIAARQWHSGFLPSRFQGVQFHSHGRRRATTSSSPPGVTPERQRDVDRSGRRAQPPARAKPCDDPEIATRIAQYEMAFRMQTSVPELMDLSDEPQAHARAVRHHAADDGSFAANCLLARRLAERGVRFIQLYHRDWDHHGGIKRDMPVSAKETDQASAALISDLKQRGMLDDTLVIWGGEFGRTPMAQGDGRDHHIKGFSHLAGRRRHQAGHHLRRDRRAGLQRRRRTSSTSTTCTPRCCTCSGIDHVRLTYRYQGRDFRLTDVAGNVVKGILA